MLRERPALAPSDFKNVPVREETKELLQELADELHWNTYEVVHALIAAEMAARGVAAPSRKSKR
jgi:hypothetical protein